MAQKYTSIYHVIFNIGPRIIKRYKDAWLKQNPRKQSYWDAYISPYVPPSAPAHMIFSAPPIQVFSLLKLVAEMNQVELGNVVLNPPTHECPVCMLEVTHLFDGTCLRCTENIYADRP